MTRTVKSILLSIAVIISLTMSFIGIAMVSNLGMAVMLIGIVLLVILVPTALVFFIDRY